MAEAIVGTVTMTLAVAVATLPVVAEAAVPTMGAIAEMECRWQKLLVTAAGWTMAKAIVGTVTMRDLALNVDEYPDDGWLDKKHGWHMAYHGTRCRPCIVKSIVLEDFKIIGLSLIHI